MTPVKVKCEHYVKHIVQCLDHSKCSLNKEKLFYCDFQVCLHPSACVTEGYILEGIRPKAELLKVMASHTF